MARFARIDSPLRANRPILANLFRVPELNPLFCESRFGGLKTADRRFEAIRANRWNTVKIGFCLRIDSRESIHANRPDLRCESPGHLRPCILCFPVVQDTDDADEREAQRRPNVVKRNAISVNFSLPMTFLRAHKAQ